MSSESLKALAVAIWKQTLLAAFVTLHTIADWTQMCCSKLTALGKYSVKYLLMTLSSVPMMGLMPSKPTSCSRAAPHKPDWQVQAAKRHILKRSHYRAGSVELTK